jgi:hypothetical protein
LIDEREILDQPRSGCASRCPGCDRTGPSLDRLEGRLRGKGPGSYLKRLADLHEGPDAHAAQQQDLGAEPLDIFEHTGGWRFEFDPGGELEVAGHPFVPVDDPVAIVQDDELAAAGEERGHFEILPLLVLSPDDGHEVQHEGCVHGAKRLPGEIESARLPEHAIGEDVDAPPPRRLSSQIIWRVSFVATRAAMPYRIMAVALVYALPEVLVLAAVGANVYWISLVMKMRHLLGSSEAAAAAA